MWSTLNYSETSSHALLKTAILKSKSTLLTATLATTLTTTLLAASSSALAETKLTTEMDKVSYAIGFIHGQRLQQDISDLKPEIFHAGFEASFSKESPLMSEEEIKETLTAYQQKRQAEHTKKQQEQAEKNLAEGKAFLDENAKKEGVKTTESGLQYKILKTGEGKKPSTTDKVKVHYHGTLIDGTVFDSSVDRGEPTSFPVNGVISGWTEALQMMTEGSEWELYIPADLAYGERAASAKIAPNSTLIFKVELLEVL